ncbi:hypothetical protein [Yoonia sp. SS1-5]|uniref:Lipoprotein n=1 Tax=Yoonia rhodophyticola TaxID=3137370 RepID=A0AAN0M977_9RHOB
MIRSIHATTMLLVALAACGPQPKSEAMTVLTLPSTPLDAGLAEFEAVCLDGKADNPDDAFLFKIDSRTDGTTLCSMRARAPKNVDVRGTLQQRYGAPQRAGLAGIVSVFTGYPRGELLHQTGIGNSAGEGTYQLAIISG